MSLNLLKQLIESGASRFASGLRQLAEPDPNIPGSSIYDVRFPPIDPGTKKTGQQWLKYFEKNHPDLNRELSLTGLSGRLESLPQGSSVSFDEILALSREQMMITNLGHTRLLTLDRVEAWDPLRLDYNLQIQQLAAPQWML